jgi:hypothetical protein
VDDWRVSRETYSFCFVCFILNADRIDTSGKVEMASHRAEADGKMKKYGKKRQMQG